MMKNLEKLKELIVKNIQPPYRNWTINNIKSNFIIYCDSIDVEIPTGHSKFGGYPDMPFNLKWPTSDKIYLFLAQINFEELPHNEIYPNCGMLYFFVNFSYPEECVVIYSLSKELNKQIPIAESYKKKNILSLFLGKKKEFKVFSECSLSFDMEYTIPSYDSLFYRMIELNLQTHDPVNYINQETYFNELYHETEDRAKHQLGGYYKGVQDSCIELTLEYEEDRNTFLKKVGIEEIEKSLEWTLLLQIDTDKRINFLWADNGKLFFFIKKKDLKKRDFSNVKVFLDTH
jgi:uncharacterized protein YwqG